MTLRPEHAPDEADPGSRRPVVSPAGPVSPRMSAPNRPTEVNGVGVSCGAANGTCGPADCGANQRVGARYSRNRCTPACTDQATGGSPIARAIATGGQTKGQGSHHQTGRHNAPHWNSPSLSGEMSGFNGRQMDPCTQNDNPALRHLIYARDDEVRI